MCLSKFICKCRRAKKKTPKDENNPVHSTMLASDKPK